LPINDNSWKVFTDYAVPKTFNLLKPTIQLIVDNKAGKVAGGVSNIPQGKGIVIYAYDEGTYDESEVDELANVESDFCYNYRPILGIKINCIKSQLSD